LLGNAHTLRAWTTPLAVLKSGCNEIEIRMSEGHPAQLTFADLAVG
jgi:hypothetical protein